MDILAEATANRERLSSIRRRIHQHPELGWQETETQKLITGELTELGIPWEAVCGTGVIATLKGALPGPVIGLRADMDALPVAEKTGAPYCSQRPGIMHACGHDCHVAILLVTARILRQMAGQLHGTVKLIFQPAEEIIEGGHALSQLPQLDDVSRITALHVWNDLDVGTFSAEEGPRMASADNIYLTVQGKSAHGAQPHQGVDAIVAACAVVEQLQLVASRMVSPLEPVVVTIGTIQGGTTSNIIANEVKMSGTVRCFSRQLRERLPQLLEQVASAAAAACGASCQLEYRPCTPAVINEPTSTAIARGCITKLFGADKLVHLERTMGGEDFAWYLEKIPGCFLFVGARNGKSYPHHHECFDIDEAALVNGAALLTQFALDAGKE